MTTVSRRHVGRLPGGVKHKRPFAVTPLLEREAQVPNTPEIGDDGPVMLLARRLASASDLPANSWRERIWKWSARGLTEREADTVAVLLGVHPSHIWSDWYTLTEEAMDCPECTGCGEVRHPTWGTRWCPEPTVACRACGGRGERRDR